MKPFQPKPKECCAPNCGKSFIPLRSMQQVCSVMCGLRLARAKKAQDKRSLRERKAALKTIPDLLKEAQRVFNAYIRERDRLAGHSCISSGRALDWSGNAVDAGHYRSVGAAPHLRFDERNVHAQSKHDNQWRAGNVVDYRLGLIQRIGLEAVIALESDNQVHKWTREELIAIRDTYKQKLKALKEKA
jgi:hypothetical protein